MRDAAGRTVCKMVTAAVFLCLKKETENINRIHTDMRKTKQEFYFIRYSDTV